VTFIKPELYQQQFKAITESFKNLVIEQKQAPEQNKRDDYEFE